jgi:ribose 5-phosphate isomerase B
MSKKILIASDHAGFDLKEKLIQEMPNDVFEDLGTNSNKSVDYTDYANEVAGRINTDNNKKGVLICGTGVGMALAANKFKNIRAGLAFNYVVAKLIREHNDANILVLPGKYMDIHEAKKCVDIFLSSKFEGGRHLRRLNKIIKD